MVQKNYKIAKARGLSVMSEIEFDTKIASLEEIEGSIWKLLDAYAEAGTHLEQLVCIKSGLPDMNVREGFSVEFERRSDSEETVNYSSSYFPKDVSVVLGI